MSSAVARNSKKRLAHGPSQGFQLCVTLMLMIVALLSACAASDGGNELEMPVTPVISVRESFAVVEQAYSPLHQDAEPSSSILAQMRRGSIVEIVGRTANREQLDGRLERWYRVRYVESEGWTFGGWIAVFETRGQAENYSRALSYD
ncbi:MAG: hypothetical protein EA428_12975 [Spirochaetaceae bacterium]|nr:MAG: hypothetical protein EA428_12975 [Spirochaetaceae bacterium]